MANASRLHRRFAGLATLALVVVVAACAQQTPPPEEEDPIDPLTLETPFSVTADNSSEAVGSVFGMLLRPFEPIGTFATEDYGPFRNGLVDTTLGADGVIEGRFIAPALVPRINDGSVGIADTPHTSYYGAYIIFFPPAECAMTTTNPDDAALVPLQQLFVWDGSSLDEDGFPVVAAVVRTERWDDVMGEDSYTETYVGIVPVMSRAAWSASSDGPCTFGDDAFVLASDVAPALGPVIERTYTYDVDVDLEVGWQFLHMTFEYHEDATTQSETVTIRTLTVDEADDLSDVWWIEGDIIVKDATTTRANPVLERLFR